MTIEECKELTIVFTKSKKRFAVFSHLIRLWTNKPYSHVARKGKLSFLPGYHYFQASEGSVNYEYEDSFNKKHEIVIEYKIKVPSHIYRDIVQKSWKSTGQSYSYMQNVGIVICDIASYFNIKMKNPWKKGVNCSELIYKTVLKPMFPELNRNENKVKPHHIESIIKSKFKTYIVKKN